MAEKVGQGPAHLQTLEVVASYANSRAPGSRKAPNGVLAFILRARYPSKKSVIEAPTKSAVHAALAPGAVANCTDSAAVLQVA